VELRRGSNSRFEGAVGEKTIWRKNLVAGGMKILHFGPGTGARDAKTAIFRIAGGAVSNLV